MQQIVETLDAELDRLHQLRAIVSEISVPVALGLEETSEPHTSDVTPDPEQASHPAIQAEETQAGKTRTRKLAGAPRSRVTTKRKNAVEASALSGTIPAGPVVVNAASVAKYHATKQAGKAPAKQADPVGTLGSMIRALHLEQLH